MMKPNTDSRSFPLPRATCTGLQRGFSLLEVLVALVVLAVGLLGLAMLQNLGLRLGHQSYERTQATVLIYEIVDRMRANPAGVRAGDYLITLTDAPPSASDCFASACTATQIATFDLSQWLSNISGQASTVNQGVTRPTLAGGKGSITRIQTITRNDGLVNDLLVDVAIQWIEQRHGDNASVTAETQTQTVRVHVP